MLFSLFKKIFGTEKSLKYLPESSVCYTFDDFDFSTRSFNHLKSIIGLAIKNDKEEVVKKILTKFFEKVKEEEKSRDNYYEHLASYLYSAMKHGSNEITSEMLSIYSENYVWFYPQKEKKYTWEKEDLSFNYYANKMYFLMKKRQDNLLIATLLNSRVFSWAIRSFDYDRLIKPTAREAVERKDLKMYRTVLNSLNVKANYLTGELIKESSFLAAKIGWLEFFEDQEYSMKLENFHHSDKRDHLGEMLLLNLQNTPQEEFIDFIFKKFISNVKSVRLICSNNKKNNETVKSIIKELIKQNKTELLKSLFEYFERERAYRDYEEVKHKSYYKEFQAVIFEEVIKSNSTEILNVYFEYLRLPDTEKVAKTLVDYRIKSKNIIEIFKEKCHSRTLKEIEIVFEKLSLANRIDEF